MTSPHRRWLALLVVGVGLFLLFVASRPAQTESLVEVPPIRIVAWLPAGFQADPALQPLTEAPYEIVTDFAILQATVAAQAPNAILIDESLLAQVDGEWLTKQHQQGTVIAGLNAHPNEVKRLINQPIQEGYQIPPIITKPFLYYNYERGVPMDWEARGSGFGSLDHFAESITNMEESLKIDQYYREQQRDKGGYYEQ